ncbi:MAG: sugar phosphate nucleotidyltransferase [Candidatus Limimorpha sp.]
MKHENRTALILSAGLGTRLKDLTCDKPKALVSINNTPLLKVLVDKLIDSGFNRIVVNIHHFGEQIIDFINDNYAGYDIKLSDERALLLDTGGAVLKALPLFGDSEAVLVHNVDIFSNLDVRSLYDEFLQCDDAAWLFTQERDSKRKLLFDKNDCFIGRYNSETGILNCADTNSLSLGELLSDGGKLLSFSGIHLLRPKYFRHFEVKPCHIFSLYGEIARNYNVKSKIINTEYWFDLGTQQQLKKAELWCLSRIQ